MAINNPSFEIDAYEWEKIQNFCDTLKFCYYFTKKTQAEQMTMSDFYVEWIALKLAMEKRIDCDFAMKLVECMGEREKDLFRNPTVLAALFLDARFRVLLKDKPLEKHTAITHLARVWKRVQDLKPSNTIPEANESEESNDNDNTDQQQTSYDELDSLLLSLDGTSHDSHNQSTICEQIVAELQKFDVEMNSVKREDRKSHPMDFWEQNKNKYKEIHILAKIIFAAAPTEVSVECCFSGLAFILNKYRYNLTDENLNTIMFIRLNENIFKNVINE